MPTHNSTQTLYSMSSHGERTTSELDTWDQVTWTADFQKLYTFLEWDVGSGQGPASFSSRRLWCYGENGRYDFAAALATNLSSFQEHSFTA